MRRVFAGLATLLVLAVVAQFYLAASGAFDPAPKDDRVAQVGNDVTVSGPARPAS